MAGWEGRRDGGLRLHLTPPLLLLRDVNLDEAACRVIQEGRPRHIGILALEAVIGALWEGYYKGTLYVSLSFSLSLSLVSNSGHYVQ